MKVIERLSNSFLVQLILTVIVYVFYGGVIGISLLPSFYLILTVSRILTPLDTLSNMFLFSISMGFSLYLFFIAGIIVMSSLIRLLSLGMKPGRYEAVSMVTLRWLVYSGIYTLATRLILPMVPMTFFTNIFFRIVGCKMGKNVRLNTWVLNDAYLLEIGNNVIIGGGTDISCHLFENNKLILKPVKIGNDTLIGAHCYISPGVVIGEKCTIGLNSFIRQDKYIPDNTVITSLAGMKIRDAYFIEKKLKTNKKG